jgi:hypothetical protein
MTAAWSCGIEVGDYTWVIEQNVDEELADAPTVLDDLRLGWSMPTNGLYPTQPDAMSAELALNLPAFADYSDIVKGDPVAITLQVPADGPIVASFYGRVTDATANPRDSKPDEDAGGVTLDLAAIDYTVDPTEQRIFGATVVATPLYEYDVLQSAFYNGYGGALPGDVDGKPDLWGDTIPDTVVPTDYFVPADPTQTKRPDEQVAAVLQQAIDPTDFGPARLILSPLIVFRRLPTSGRRFTLDTIYRSTAPDAATILVSDAAAVDMAVAWHQTKGDAPDRVVATYGPSNLQTVATASGATTPYIDLPLQLQLEDSNGARADDVAEFYLPVDSDDSQPWQAKSLSFFVDQLDPSILADFPTTLFPQWWNTTEGDFDRGFCYNAWIQVVNVEPTVHPSGDTAFYGRLVGAEARIRDGLVEFDLALRDVRFGTPE